MGVVDGSAGGVLQQPLKSPLTGESLGGHSILEDFISFDPFFKSGYSVGTTNDKISAADNAVAWNGYANGV